MNIPTGKQLLKSEHGVYYIFIFLQTQKIFLTDLVIG